MPTVNIPVQLDVKHLMRAVKRLSPDELHEFAQQFTSWRDQTRRLPENEDDLITHIEKILVCLTQNSDASTVCGISSRPKP